MIARLLMARREPAFICQTCSTAYERLQGLCDVCREYDTITGSYPRHLDTGIPFQQWLNDPAGFRVTEPIGLEEISELVTGSFSCDPKQWQEAMQRSVAQLLQRGWRPMLPDPDTGRWDWTDRFTDPREFGEGPMGIAAAAVLSLQAFGDSGGAKVLRFGTKLPADGSGGPR